MRYQKKSTHSTPLWLHMHESVTLGVRGASESYQQKRSFMTLKCA